VNLSSPWKRFDVKRFVSIRPAAMVSGLQRNKQNSVTFFDEDHQHQRGGCHATPFSARVEA
jgi:hypothetical protein